MRESEVYDLLQGTADAGFVVTVEGVVSFCNTAAERLLGFSAARIVGSACSDVFQGIGRSGERVCSSECALRKGATTDHLHPCFDMEITTAAGRRWVNVSTINIHVTGRGLMIIHLLRDAEAHKHLEEAADEFLAQITRISAEGFSGGAATPHIELTVHERTILSLLSQGRATNEISRELHVSVATVRNHVQHILQKLSAHSRSQAVIRAFRERLI